MLPDSTRILTFAVGSILDTYLLKMAVKFYDVFSNVCYMACEMIKGVLFVSIMMRRRRGQIIATFVTFYGILYSRSTGMNWKRLGTCVLCSSIS